MSAIGHEMIFASAGSGKTFALTTRFIRLLALGVAPERIVALTFTRKAAGEFFGEILKRLAEAAAEETKAARLAKDVGQPALARADFGRLLRGAVRAMHRLNLGTLDGFFARVVRSFPLELGLGGEPGVLDDHTAAEETRRVLGLLFAAPRGLTPEQRDLIDAFKLATFGTEGKEVGGRIESFVATYLALYRSAPEPTRWGDVRRIWPDGFPWGHGAEKPEGPAAVLRAWATGAGLKDKQLERWTKFAAAAAAWTPGEPLAREIVYVLEKALEAWDAVEAGAAELKFDRAAQKLSPDACAALAALVRRIVALELARRMRVTEGIAKVLRAFDALYDAEVRRAGRLTFADLQQLLAPAAGAARLSSGAGDDARLQLDYRIDARLDHWMFDEFQDTSAQQWQILQPLVDEVVNDPDGRRSLFYVGDVKQAIYTWRGGDPRLFEVVAQRYADAPGGLKRDTLEKSYRSCPAVIDLVNTVFGDELAIAELFPEAAGEWKKQWRAHESAKKDVAGQAALLVAADEDGRWRTTLELLRQIDPVARGLSCVVLVPKNSTGAKLADYLRREGGIPAVAEADLQVGADNPVATALAALLQAAVHPGDTLAQRHVAMSPLGACLAAEGADSPAALTGAVLREVNAAGFEAWVAGWARRLEPKLARDDAFSRMRLGQLVAAARAFDATGRREADAFLRFLGEHAVREPEGAGVVRVMTVHKSKGLGFDVVILPDLQGDKLAQRRDGPAVQKADDRSVEWVLEFPGALIAERDPVLGAYVAQAVAENCYEQMSLLYVALTRAKRGLYLVVEPPKKSSTSKNFPRWLLETLGEEPRPVAVGGKSFEGTWASGAADWFAATTAATPAARSDEAPTVSAESRAALPVRLPSETSPRLIAAESLFRADGAEAAEFGSAVHALFAEVEWCEPAEAAARAAAWRAAGRPAGAVTAAAACLAAPGWREVFSRRPATEVWRERAFEAVLDGAWVSGVFDRVLVTRDAGGAITKVQIYDFKTDRAADAATLRARHAAQLGIYRRAAALLAGVPESAVTAAVVSTGVAVDG